MGSLHVKVMSLNIRYDNPHDGSNSWPHRKTLVCDVLRENAPDFIGLQEALKHQLEDIIHALEGYDGYGRSRRAYTEDDEWSPLCYDSKRWWLDQRQRGTFWLSDTPDHEGSQSWGSSPRSREPPERHGGDGVNGERRRCWISLEAVAAGGKALFKQHQQAAASFS